MTEKDFGEAVSPSERRISTRKKLIIDVRFSGGDGTAIANTRDIGIGGLYMTTTAHLNTGTPIMMTMTLSGRSMELNGVVAYSDPGYGVGVRFHDLSPDDLVTLKNELELA
jgi:PilZ domain